ncbi:GntR family transcriptional regulator [Compostimonas suwonensis]|uniref:DNA-binding GntR family transcriptional regulator n=1 Tax=Compostimonas suwonensis TaxID=1048394 RepID=A0A2M9BVL0_9MICO|nr:GntR family transcriptional regulator [Compostimonas suwonensis]PJJ61997.1 DNA-binding GntR family transcriptional regulator [Compostimonas suwonensis]
MSSQDTGNGRALPARRPLVDDVYEAVLSLLMDNVIEPGAKASIDGIARTLDVSPTPVREALVRLEAEGMVTKRALRGYVASPMLDEEGLVNLFEMRRLLEPVSARHAASKLTPEVLDELESSTTAMHAAVEASSSAGESFKDYKDFANEDARFHMVIAEHCGNSLLFDAISRLRSHMHLYRLYFRFGIAEETSGEHEAILAALRAGDAERAEQAMLEHIQQSYARLSSTIAGAESNS